MASHEILIAGFGGQGILFTGKLIAYAGFVAGSEVTWLPSYGPETRGGTSNCSVVISNEPVGSPMVTNPDSLIVMNLPSLDKFESAVKSGGTVYLDETLINRIPGRDDIKCVGIPATRLADENGLTALANLVMTGRLIKDTGMFTPDEIKASIEKCVPKSKPEMVELNMKAFNIGYNY